MVILKERDAKIVELSEIDGKTQIDIARELKVHQTTVSRVLEQFGRELACIIGDRTKRTPAFVRDVIARMLGNASIVRQSMAA